MNNKHALKTDDLGHLLTPFLTFGTTHLKKQMQVLTEIKPGVFVNTRIYGVKTTVEKFKKDPESILKKLAEDINHDNKLTPFDYVLALCTGLNLDDGGYYVLSYLSSSKDTPI